MSNLELQDTGGSSATREVNNDAIRQPQDGQQQPPQQQAQQAQAQQQPLPPSSPSMQAQAAQQQAQQQFMQQHMQHMSSPFANGGMQGAATSPSRFCWLRVADCVCVSDGDVKGYGVHQVAAMQVAVAQAAGWTQH